MQAGIRAGEGPVQNRQRLRWCKTKAVEALDEVHQALVAERVEGRGLLRAYAVGGGLSLIWGKDGEAELAPAAPVASVSTRTSRVPAAERPCRRVGAGARDAVLVPAYQRNSLGTG